MFIPGPFPPGHRGSADPGTTLHWQVPLPLRRSALGRRTPEPPASALPTPPPTDTDPGSAGGSSTDRPDWRLDFAAIAVFWGAYMLLRLGRGRRG